MKKKKKLQLCLFLGAVRDMYNYEYQALNNVCSKTHLNIPVVGIRLGTVPEFTSKILSILAFHHSQQQQQKQKQQNMYHTNNILGNAIQRLVIKKRRTNTFNNSLVASTTTVTNSATTATATSTTNHAAAIDAANSNAKNNNNEFATTVRAATSAELIKNHHHEKQSTCLHVIAFVPISSTTLSTELTHRDHTHWMIVRLIVTTLWRSKLVSSSSSSSSQHSNTLTLIFTIDQMVITLTENEFVNILAKQHQAAPCEYQILKALQEKMSGNVDVVATSSSTAAAAAVKTENSQAVSVQSSPSSSIKPTWSKLKTMKKKKFAKHVMKEIITTATKTMPSSEKVPPATGTIVIDSSTSGTGDGTNEDLDGNMHDSVVHQFYNHNSDNEAQQVMMGSWSSSSASSATEGTSTIFPSSEIQHKQHQEQHYHRHHSVIAILDLADNNDAHDNTGFSKNNNDDNSSNNKKLMEAFIRASTKLNLPVLKQCQIVSRQNCDDWVGATIVAIQHFCYQNRLFLPFPKSSITSRVSLHHEKRQQERQEAEEQGHRSKTSKKRKLEKKASSFEKKRLWKEMS